MGNSSSSSSSAAALFESKVLAKDGEVCLDKLMMGRRRPYILIPTGSNNDDFGSTNQTSSTVTIVCVPGNEGVKAITTYSLVVGNNDDKQQQVYAVGRYLVPHKRVAGFYDANNGNLLCVSQRVVDKGSIGSNYTMTLYGLQPAFKGQAPDEKATAWLGSSNSKKAPPPGTSLYATCLIHVVAKGIQASATFSTIDGYNNDQQSNDKSKNVGNDAVFQTTPLFTATKIPAMSKFYVVVETIPNDDDANKVVVAKFSFGPMQGLHLTTRVDVSPGMDIPVALALVSAIWFGPGGGCVF